MSYTEKIDVLDLLIETLKEHEKALDEIVTRLEWIYDPAADQRRRFYESP